MFFFFFYKSPTLLYINLATFLHADVAFVNGVHISKLGTNHAAFFYFIDDDITKTTTKNKHLAIYVKSMRHSHL